MSEAMEQTTSSGQTDFGRALATQPVQSLADAVREHTRRKEAAELRRYRLGMLMTGYLGGLLLIMPLVVWLASSGPVGLRSPFSAATADAGQPPKLVSAPLLTTRASQATEPTVPQAAPDPSRTAPASLVAPQRVATAPGDGLASPPPAEPAADPRERFIEAARGLIDQGHLLEARRTLSDPRFERMAEAQFLLAETYDPNVLAAVGATGIQADVAVAERHYRLARDLGSPNATQRLRALD